MIKTKAIDHICLWVRSLDKSQKYYEQVFGMVCTRRKDDPSTLVVESENVHFFMSQCQEGDAESIAKQHLSFEVETLEDVIAVLKKMGITKYETGEVRLFNNRNYKWCEWRDPDGIRLECIEIL